MIGIVFTNQHEAGAIIDFDTKRKAHINPVEPCQIARQILTGNTKGEICIRIRSTSGYYDQTLLAHSNVDLDGMLRSTIRHRQGYRSILGRAKDGSCWRANLFHNA